jgi:hypothetical protein
MPKEEQLSDVVLRKQELDRRFVAGVMSLIYSEHGYREYAERIRQKYPYLEDLAAECDARAALMQRSEQSPIEKIASKSEPTKRYGK